MRGSCLCGLVKYEISDSPRPVVGCHCTQCRKSSGHYVAATQTTKSSIAITGQDHLTWFQSSQTARRGFCATCGSQMFWTEETSDNISVMAGSIDGDSGLSMDRQLYPDDKGDYYALPEVAVVDQSTLK
jgi:hypothetical protein